MKIVAIGGGITYKDEKGLWKCSFDSSIERIIELSNKTTPNVLILSHASPNSFEEKKSSSIISLVFEYFGCNTKILLSDELTEKNKCQDYVEWADIIYENGGDTLKMIELWNKTAFSTLLISANDNNKVLCGQSAGANCWFSHFNSIKNNHSFNGNGLSLIDAYYVPHAVSQYDYRIDSALSYLKGNTEVGLFVPDDYAIEIVDDKYRIIYNDFGFEPKHYHVNCKYYDGDKLISHNVDNYRRYKVLKKLIRK